MSSVVIEQSTIETPQQWAQELLDVCAAILADTAGGTIDRQYRDHELPSNDCAQIVVTLGPVTMRAVARNTELSSAHAHAMGWLTLVTFKIYVVRDCVPVTSDDGRSAPTPAQKNAMQAILAQDMWALWNIIPLRMESGDLFGGRCAELFMDQAVPMPQSGMTAGWTITMRAGMPGFTPGQS